jgi:hypothetical protein
MWEKIRITIKEMQVYQFNNNETTEWWSFHLVPRFEECSPGVVGNLIILGGNIISYFSCVPGLKFSEGIDPSLGLSNHKLLEEK